MNNIFNKVREAVQNAIDNGYDPLAMKARELAGDLIEKASELGEDAVEAVTDAVEQVKQHFEGEDKNG